MLYKACYHGRNWILSQAPKVGRSEEEVWEEIPFTRDSWLKVRDLLWRKYQRKRGSWRIIEEIDKILEDEFPENSEQEEQEEESGWKE